jgi:hypothetical protein
MTNQSASFPWDKQYKEIKMLAYLVENKRNRTGNHDTQVLNCITVLGSIKHMTENIVWAFFIFIEINNSIFCARKIHKYDIYQFLHNTVKSINIFIF